MTPQPGSLTGTILSPRGTISYGSVDWDAAGIITSVSETRREIADESGDPGLLICPGFINLHVHGGMAADTLDASLDSLTVISRDQARQGVTAYLPTAASASHESLAAVCRNLRVFLEAQNPQVINGAEVLGLHLEGPYFNPARAGAQDPAHFRDPDAMEIKALQESSGNAIRLLSLAPERDPDGAFIQDLNAAGIRVAAGHTDASYEVMRTAIENGLRHGTHVFNAMPRFDYRSPGGLEALLEDDRVMLELIPDCTELPHVHPAAIRLLKRMVGPDRICTITDAVSAAGLPDGRYRLGDLAIRKSGDIVFLDEPWTEREERRLAGSVLEMNHGVRNLVRLGGFTLEEAVRTASINPARAIGAESEKGSLEPGKHADIVVLRPGSLEVASTFVRGKKVYGHG